MIDLFSAALIIYSLSILFNFHWIKVEFHFSYNFPLEFLFMTGSYISFFFKKRLHLKIKRNKIKKQLEMEEKTCERNAFNSISCCDTNTPFARILVWKKTEIERKTTVGTLCFSNLCLHRERERMGPTKSMPMIGCLLLFRSCLRSAIFRGCETFPASIGFLLPFWREGLPPCLRTRIEWIPEYYAE